VAGSRSPAHIHDRPDRQHRKLDALQQAQRAGQFVQQQLRRERHDQDHGNRIETEDI
jgi:hypothetical protein